MRLIMLSLTVAAAVCAVATAAAAQGYAPAQNNLANLYARGLGVSKNEAEAARLLKLAGAHYTPRRRETVPISGRIASATTLRSSIRPTCGTCCKC